MGFGVEEAGSGGADAGGSPQNPVPPGPVVRAIAQSNAKRRDGEKDMELPTLRKTCGISIKTLPPLLRDTREPPLQVPLTSERGFLLAGTKMAC